MNEKYRKVFAGLYFALLIVTSINMFLLTTIFEYEKLKFLLNSIQLILQFSIILKIALEWKRRWSNKDIICAILTAGVFLLAACKFNIDDAFAYAVLILGAKDVDRKKILKIFLCINLALFFITIGACLLGVLENTITYRSTDSNHARMALGFIYTTAVSAHFLTLVVCYVMIREKRMTWFEIIVIGISSGVIYYLTEARIASFTIFLIFCGLVVAKICHHRKYELRFIRVPVVKWLMIFSSSILMVISIIMSVFYKYDNVFWEKINHIFSQRPLTNAITFHRYPVTLLGRRILLHCNIYDGMNELPECYYIINCSYVSVLFSLGVLGAVAVIGIWAFLSNREVKNNNYLNLYVLAVLTLFFFFEQRLFDFTYNPLLILLFSSYAEGDNCSISDIDDIHQCRFRDIIIRSAVTGLVLAFLIEVIFFNFKSISTLLYEGTTIDSAEVYSDGLYGDEKYDMFVYSKSNPIIVLDELKTYDDLESIFTEFHFFTKDDHYHYRLVDNVKYNVECYSYVGDGDYELLESVTINSSDRASGYIPVDVPGPMQNLLLKFTFPEDYYLYISFLEFNGPKPFDLNGYRIVAMWVAIAVILCIISSAKGEKQNNKVIYEDETDEIVN